jgi:hypothetical protein
MQPMQYGYSDESHYHHSHMHMHEPTPPPPPHRGIMPYIHTAFEGSPSYKRRRMRPRDSASGTPMSESARGPSVDVDSTDPDLMGDDSFASGKSPQRQG